MSTSPNRSFEPPSQVQSGSATIGKAVMVKGQIYSREDLIIDGEVEGTVDVQDHRFDSRAERQGRRGREGS